MALHAIATSMADGSGPAYARPHMPPGLEGYENKYGWQNNETIHVFVAREPVNYRVHEDKSFDLRTTWIRTLLGWTCVENRVNWTKLCAPRTRLSHYSDRGVFVFERSAAVAAAPAVHHRMTGRVKRSGIVQVSSAAFIQSCGATGSKCDILTRELQFRALIPVGARVVVGAQGPMPSNMRVRYVIISAMIGNKRVMNRVTVISSSARSVPDTHVAEHVCAAAPSTQRAMTQPAEDITDQLSRLTVVAPDYLARALGG